MVLVKNINVDYLCLNTIYCSINRHEEQSCGIYKIGRGIISW